MAFVVNVRKQPTSPDNTTGFPAKWRLRNDCKNSVLMTCHYPDLCSASDWSYHEENLLQPIRSTIHFNTFGRHANNLIPQLNTYSNMLLASRQRKSKNEVTFFVFFYSPESSSWIFAAWQSVKITFAFKINIEIIVALSKTIYNMNEWGIRKQHGRGCREKKRLLYS